MIKKRYIIVALGVVSVLLGSLLVNNIILAQTGGEYDPWLDYNEDGIIDVNDLSPLGQAYGSSGDPTKNVTIVKHATKVIRAATGISLPASGIWNSGYISVDGYAKVTILINLGTNNNVYILRANSGEAISFNVDSAVDFDHNYVKTYDVMNPQILVWVQNMDAAAANLYVDIYLMA